MKEEGLSESQQKEILAALDTAINDGPWEDTNFLRILGKNLKKIRDDFAEHITMEVSISPTQQKALNRLSAQSQLQEVFVSLYSIEGNSIQAWERLLVNLPRYVVSRPIYANETDVRSLVRSKPNKVNEAYVGIYIAESDLITTSSDRVLKDKFGKQLLSLKDRALNLDNISKFIHMSGEYSYLNNHLVKNSVSDL